MHCSFIFLISSSSPLQESILWSKLPEDWMYNFREFKNLLQTYFKFWAKCKWEITRKPVFQLTRCSIKKGVAKINVCACVSVYICISTYIHILVFENQLLTIHRFAFQFCNTNWSTKPENILGVSKPCEEAKYFSGTLVALMNWKLLRLILIICDLQLQLLTRIVCIMQISRDWGCLKWKGNFVT